MKKILISVNPWQTRIAVTRDSELQNIYFSSHAKEALERSFFKGTVIKVLPGIQTAFVDFGAQRAGFLHISEIDHQMALERMSESVDIDDTEVSPPKEQEYRTPSISKILQEGETVLVQVSKEPVYEKGAKLTTCFTVPGRFIVLMPNIPRIAISKKIEDRQERQRLKEIIRNLLPEGMGAIIRTTSEHRQEKEIVQDVQYLVSCWEQIKEKYTSAQPQEKIYEDLPLSLQVVRDYLDNDVEAVVSDNKTNQQEIYRFIKKMAPEYAYKVQLYSGHQDLFERYTINAQIQEALSAKVELKSGGSIIIESTQAMTVVDVNTGKYTGKTDLEETILNTNLEAAEEIARQLRLRNIGGLIVIDFIDMASAGNRHKVFKSFERVLKERDKSQSVVLKISEFCVVQMTRKRTGKTLIQELMQACSTCTGLGHVKTIQTICYGMMPQIKESLYQYRRSPVLIAVHPSIFEYIIHVEYNSILQFEKDFECKITLVEDDQCPVEEFILSRP